MKHEINVAASKLIWHASKVSGKHHGSIALSSGWVEIDANGLLAGGEFVIDMPSLAVLDDMTKPMKNMLTDHLKSTDFFAVEEYPQTKLSIKRVATTQNGAEITADLTIRGKTNEIVFPAEISQSDGKWRAKADIKLDRLRWDIKFRSGKFFSGLGDALIHDTFSLEVDVVTV